MEEHCRECGLNLYNADEEGLYDFFDNTDPLCVDCACDLSNDYYKKAREASQIANRLIKFEDYHDKKSTKKSLIQIIDLLNQ